MRFIHVRSTEFDSEHTMVLSEGVCMCAECWQRMPIDMCTY